jgi:predicted aspartyl protease
MTHEERALCAAGWPERRFARFFSAQWGPWRAAGVLACMLLGGPAAAACTLTPVATLPLSLANGRALTTVDIDGTAVRMVVDTGAGATALDRRSAAGLKLRPDRSGRRAILGVGGAGRVQDGLLAARIELGGLQLRDVPLLQGDLHLSVGAGTGASGVLGADILARYDVDFDPARRRLVLNEAAGCAGQYVEGAGQAVPLQAVGGTALRRLPVTIDGVAMAALLDTGATQSVLFRPGTAKLGAAARPGPGDRRGFGFGAAGGRAVATVEHRFGSLRIGTETVAGPSLAMAAASPMDLDMILGSDILGGRRLWISYRTGQLFLFPDGAARP